ncbi:MAG: hypothetical protein ACYTG0_21100 [Planctomycetota bacterium]|jgi:hypothetical protein
MKNPLHSVSVGLVFLLGATAGAQNPILRTMLNESQQVVIVVPISVKGGEGDEEGVEEWIAECKIVAVIKGDMKEGAPVIVHFDRFTFKAHREPAEFRKNEHSIVFLKGKAAASHGEKAAPVYRLLDRWLGVMPYDWHLANALNPEINYDEKVRPASNDDWGPENNGLRCRLFLAAPGSRGGRPIDLLTLQIHNMSHGTIPIPVYAPLDVLMLTLLIKERPEVKSPANFGGALPGTYHLQPGEVFTFPLTKGYLVAYGTYEDSGWIRFGPTEQPYHLTAKVRVQDRELVSNTLRTTLKSAVPPAPSDPVKRIEALIPADMRIVRVRTGMVRPVYRPRAAGTEVWALRRALGLNESKGPDVKIHLMDVPYDDGGAFPDAEDGQTEASLFVGSNEEWQVYVHGGGTALRKKLVEVLALTPSNDPIVDRR